MTGEIKRMRNISILSWFILLASTNVFASQPTLPKATYISVQEARQWQKEGKKVIFVDVREPQEYEAGHIEGAVNIPYREIEQRINEIGDSSPYVFYCIHSSWRAPYVANLLADQGYTNVYILEGGIAAWNAGGQVIYSSIPNQEPGVALYPQGLEKKLTHPKDRTYSEKFNLTKEELKIYTAEMEIQPMWPSTALFMMSRKAGFGAAVCMIPAKEEYVREKI